MKALLLWSCVLVSACGLGAEDHRLATIDVEATQPDPDSGLFVDISANCGTVQHQCLLQVTAVDATLRRAGDDAATATFCQHQALTTPLPILVFPAGSATEVVVQARLLDGDAKVCEGLLLAQTEAIVSAEGDHARGGWRISRCAVNDGSCS